MKKCLVALLTTLTLISASTAEAYTNKEGQAVPLTTSQYDSKDPFSWSQTVAPYAGTFGPYGKSFQQESCMIHAATFVQIKTGYKPIGYTPYDLFQTLEATNAYAYGFADYAKIDWGNDWQMLPGDGGDAFSYRSASYQDAVDAWYKGYMVVMRVMSPAGAHQIAIDTILDDGTMIIFDSGFANQKFSDTYSKSDVRDIVLYKSKTGKKAYNLPTLYNHRNDQQIYAVLEQNGQPAKTQDDLIREAQEAVQAKAQQAKAQSQANVSQAKYDNLRLAAQRAVNVAKAVGTPAAKASAITAISRLKPEHQASLMEQLR